MANVNIEEQVNSAVKNLPDYNYMLGRTLMQPFKTANSGSRSLMYTVHSEHLVVLNNPEIPIVQTGYETEFGKKSNSYVENKSDYRVLYKIHKFDNHPDWHYYLIVQDLNTGEYDVIERISYNSNTESYGFLWNNERLDRLSPGDVIKKGSILKTSIGYDEYGNKANGVNLITLYLSSAQNMEDSIILSESGAKKLETSLINDTSIAINDNDILLDLYGDGNVYKTFPDIGEKIKNGIFCSIRRIENENILFSMSRKNLRDIMLSDRNILMEGIVADINVYSNNPETLSQSYYNSQLYYYYNQYLRFCKELSSTVGPLAMNSKLSYKLKKLYSICTKVATGKPFFKDKLFSNVIMEIKVIQPMPIDLGDKISDRYGGKGVVSKIYPDEMMPLLENGRRVEVIKNQSTCINRENIGQLHEQSLTFIGMRLLDHFRLGYMTYPEMAKMYHKFVSMVDEQQAKFIADSIDLEDEFQSKVLIDSILEDDAIVLDIQPFTSRINNIDEIAKIYKEFDFIDQYSIMMPLEDSNGNIRMAKAMRKMVVGNIYNYRLKQYAEEKFSVTSLSATNLKNLNTRSKANKMYEAKYTKTPIMFGFMESGDMIHLGVQYVVMNLMIHSSSPQARRLVEQLLIGDPYNIDIKLDQYSKNRNAEIINALLDTMGLRIVFKKIPKKAKQMVLNVMAKVVPPRLFEPKTNIRDIMGRFDELEMQYLAALSDRQDLHPMVNKIMCKKVGDTNEASDNTSEENTVNTKRRKSKK